MVKEFMIFGRPQSVCELFRRYPKGRKKNVTAISSPGGFEIVQNFRNHRKDLRNCRSKLMELAHTLTAVTAVTEKLSFDLLFRRNHLNQLTQERAHRGRTIRRSWNSDNCLGAPDGKHVAMRPLAPCCTITRDSIPSFCSPCSPCSPCMSHTNPHLLVELSNNVICIRK